MAFWHCIGDAPVGVPPEEGDYWEPDPGPADGYARLGCAVPDLWWALPYGSALASRVSVSTGVVHGLFLVYGAPSPPVEELIDWFAVSAYLTYAPATLAVTGAYVYSWPGTVRMLWVMDEGFNVLLEAGPAEYEVEGWLPLSLNGSLDLVGAATYWLEVGGPEGEVGLVNSGPGSNAPYSAWVATEDYHYCDYVAYPVPEVPEAGRHVLPHLKRTTLGEGTLIPGGASLCR